MTLPLGISLLLLGLLGGLIVAIALVTRADPGWIGRWTYRRRRGDRR